LFASLAEKIDKDKALEQMVYEIGRFHSVFHLPNFRDILDRGMQELKSEGWIRMEEADDILTLYAT